jgi:translation initiation factor IF-1
MCARRMNDAERKGPQLAKEELLTMEGQIDEILPDGRFGVMLDNEHRIIAYTAGKMRKFRIRSVVGDRVHVEMTPYDLSKGRIIFREKTPGQGGGGPRRTFRR